MTFFSFNTLKSVSMNNQDCKIRSAKIDINSNEPTFYPYSIEVNKCSGSYNNINDSYSKFKRNIHIKKRPSDYDEKYIKIKFNSDNNLPLNKILKFHNLIIVVRSVFQGDNKKCMYEL